MWRCPCQFDAGGGATFSPDEGIPGRAGYCNIQLSLLWACELAQVAVAECSIWPCVFTSRTVSVGLLGSARNCVLL
jgi:hypothetical protein